MAFQKMTGMGGVASVVGQVWWFSSANALVFVLKGIGAIRNEWFRNLDC